jgi:hypothetical protein
MCLRLGVTWSRSKEEIAIKLFKVEEGDKLNDEILVLCSFPKWTSDMRGRASFWLTTKMWTNFMKLFVMLLQITSELTSEYRTLWKL